MIVSSVCVVSASKVEQESQHRTGYDTNDIERGYVPPTRRNPKKVETKPVPWYKILMESSEIDDRFHTHVHSDLNSDRRRTDIQLSLPSHRGLSCHMRRTELCQSCVSIVGCGQDGDSAPGRLRFIHSAQSRLWSPIEHVALGVSMPSGIGVREPRCASD